MQVWSPDILVQPILILPVNHLMDLPPLEETGLDFLFSVQPVSLLLLRSQLSETQAQYLNWWRWIDEKQKWEDLKSIIKIETLRENSGQQTTETRYYISSLLQNADYFNDAIRKHWGIENSFHWVLDVQFRDRKSVV